MSRELSLYIHIPFCESKCSYCDFASFVGCTSRMDSYIDALCGEIKHYANKYSGAKIESIYIGGGTPSMLKNGQLSKIVRNIKKYFCLDEEWFNNHEVTIEANPNSVTGAKAKHWVGLGINRVSVGVQSLDTDILKILGRTHTAVKARTALDILCEHFDNISVDYMYGVPLALDQLETYRDIFEEVSSLIEDCPEIKHVSAYALTVEAGTPIHARITCGDLIELDEDDFFDEEDLLQASLRSWGFKRYEVSNFAIPGYESKHNRRYWDPRKEYLGLGLAAHGLVDGVRYENTEKLDMYLLNPNKVVRTHAQTRQELADELIMLGLRTDKGIDLPALMKMGIDFRLRKAREIFELESAKLIRVNKRNIRATHEGMCVLTSLTSRLLLSMP